MGQFDLKGRTALITGGNGGIGLGIARGLARAGAAVMIAGRNAEKNERARAELAGEGATVETLVVDVADEAACRQMVTATAERLGRLDVLVNNAGISLVKRTETMAMDDWRRVMDINLTSVIVCAQAAYPLMKAQGGGKIINIGSMYSLFGSGVSAAYAASKGAVVQLTKSMAISWAKDNIQTNALLPGWIATDMSNGARERVAGFDQRIVDRTPAARWGEPEDFQGPAVFLASAASDFVTGISLAVDGGYSISG